MDFLQRNQCTIDIPGRKLTLTDGTIIPQHTKASTTYDVRLVETTTIPPRCEMEVTGQSTLSPGLWFLEGRHFNGQSVVIARALTESRCSITVRSLNTSNEAITLHRGTKVGDLLEIDERQIGAVTTTSAHHATDKVEQDRLLHLVHSSPSISVKQKEDLAALLQQYADIFAAPGDKLGRTTKLRHYINTGTAPPIRQHLRRTPPAQRTAAKELLKEMRHSDVVQPSSSGWASPIVLAKKKDGTVRFCVDYRKLNQVTHKDAYPLPRIDDTLEMLSESQLFSTLDLASSYWQVELAEEDRAKTAFCTTEGLYEFKVMPFGLCNAPATFQRLMDVVLCGLQWTTCLVYLDDIIVMGRTFK